MAASALHALGRNDEIASHFAPQVGEAVAAGVQQMLTQNLNCPATSSTGRWFDAAAGALGLSVRQTDEAQAAIALEAAAARWLAQNPHIARLPGEVIDAQNRLDLRGLMPALFDARADGVDAAAAVFHLALADALAGWATRAARQQGSTTVCFGGGCFFNRILRERLTERLQAAGLAVLLPFDKGCGDAGLALGQACAAAQRWAAATHEQPMKETAPCV
jgi:hydrogenase maturation protein HypF